MIIGILSLAEASLYVGGTMLALATIWGILFLYPKSPVKKYWWVISDKLIFRITQESGYKAKVGNEIISIWVDLISSSSIVVDRIVLKIGREKGVPSFEWNSHMVEKEHKFLDFRRPNWLDVGRYKARLFAYTPDGFSKSEKFILEVDSQNAQT